MLNRQIGYRSHDVILACVAHNIASSSVLKLVTDNIYFRQQYDFPVNVFIMWLILIQKNTHCQWIEIVEYPEYKFYDNISDLSIRSF